jgi:hypothetical protein
VAARHTSLTVFSLAVRTIATNRTPAIQRKWLIQLHRTLARFIGHFRSLLPETSSRTEVPLAQYGLLIGELPADLNDDNSVTIL